MRPPVLLGVRSAIVAFVLLLGGQPWAADNVVLGKKLLVKDRTGLENDRVLVLLGKESPTDVSFTNLVPISASLRVILNGQAGSDTTYPLGAPGQWQGLPSGALKYTNGDPAKLILLKQSANGTFTLKAKLKGSAGPASLDSVPPNPGLDGGIILTLDQGSGPQQFCVTLGEAAGGTSTMNGATLWKVTNATAQPGCIAFVAPESETGSVGGGGTVDTDTEADGATPPDPVETAVTTPTGGTVEIDETPRTVPDPSGFELFGQQVDVTAPPAGGSDPLTLVFLVDSSVIPPGRDPATLQPFRDGVPVGPCVGGPGIAFPDPCVADRTTIGDDIQLTVLSTHASTWVIGLPLCGNGVVNPGAGEACDPPGLQAQCGGGETCKSDCQCGTPCNCCALSPARFELTTGIGAGSCGTALTSSGGTFTSLACNGIYTGGGQNSVPMPWLMPDQVKLNMNVAACDSATERLTLTAATAGQTGSARTCTTQGCLFGPPLPIPNAGTPAVSACGMLTVAANASGTSSCDGATDIALPLNMEVFLTGDTATDPGGTIPGVQPCPLCTGTCQGGPNNGMACTPASSDFGDSHPTSQDCPPDPMLSIGTIPIGASFTTGLAAATATATGAQPRVFCGYCRDFDDTLDFQSPPQPCTTDAQCAQPFESCQQRSQGAFGPNGGAVKTITLAGSPASCLADGGPHSATLVGGTCIAPTFTATVDAAADYPGPAALSLQGNAQLLAATPSCGCGPSAPSTFTFTTGVGGGDCGDIINATGTIVANTNCNFFYWGGGFYSFPGPTRMIDQAPSIANVTSCSSGSITLGARTAAETGSNRNCTSTGCFFGPPTPVPNPSSTPTSHCILYHLSSDLSGSASCATGTASLSMPIVADLYLTGDVETDPSGTITGIQPCPLCSSGSCVGGANNGMSCTAVGTDFGDSYPTSQDCPPSPGLLLDPPPPLAFNLTTAPTTWTGTVATNDTGSTASVQSRVFAGYCRDTDGSLCFKGDPNSLCPVSSPGAQQCWLNGMAVGAACSGTFESCEQRSNGAFGPNGGGVKTLTLLGAAAGALTDNLAHAATLATLFSVGPTDDATVNAALDFPGPGAVTLQGTFQVQ